MGSTVSIINDKNKTSLSLYINFLDNLSNDYSQNIEYVPMYNGNIQFEVFTNDSINVTNFAEYNKSLLQLLLTDIIMSNNEKRDLLNIYLRHDINVKLISSVDLYILVKYFELCINYSHWGYKNNKKYKLNDIRKRSLQNNIKIFDVTLRLMRNNNFDLEKYLNLLDDSINHVIIKSCINSALI